MGKLKLKANPTFPAKVGIPVAGAEPVEMNFIFHHKTKAAMIEFMDTINDRTDEQSVMQIVAGWDFDEEFTLENATEMLQNYAGAGQAIYRKWVDELLQNKAKN